MVIAMTVGAYGVLASPLFRVQEVVVVGADGPTAERIAARLARQRGANLLAVEAADVQAATAGEPRVARAWLVRRLPSTLEVAVLARDPVAEVPVADRFWEVDRLGVVLGPATRPGAHPALTGVVQPGEGLAVARPGPPRLVQAAALVSELGPVLGERLAGLHVDEAGERWVYLTDGSVIRWGVARMDADEAARDARRVEVLAALVAELGSARPFEADLRDPLRATWRPR